MGGEKGRGNEREGKNEGGEEGKIRKRRGKIGMEDVEWNERESSKRVEGRGENKIG